MVLELDMDLPSCSFRCQDVYPVTVPSRLPHAMVPQDQHRLDRICLCLLRLDEL